MFDRDSGHKTFLEDVFEKEARMIPGGNWGPASSPWTNVVGYLVTTLKVTVKVRYTFPNLALLLIYN